MAIKTAGQVRPPRATQTVRPIHVKSPAESMRMDTRIMPMRGERNYSKIKSVPDPSQEKSQWGTSAPDMKSGET